MVFQLLHDGLQAFLEIAAITGACQKRAHVQRKDRRARQNVGGFPARDLQRQAFRNGGLAHAGIAHQKRVVLAAAAQNLDGAFNLGFAADQGVHVAFLGFGIQIDAVFPKRGFVLGLGCGFGLFLFRLVRSDHLAVFVEGRVLGHAMGNEVDRVIAGHVHFLQEEGRIRFAFGKDRDQDIGARHFLPARALDMDRGALDHPLEGGGGNGLGSLHVGDEGGQVIFDEIDQQLAQFVQIDIAGAHHLDRIRFLGQGQQQMFQRRKLVSMFVRQRKRLVNGLFQ